MPINASEKQLFDTLCSLLSVFRSDFSRERSFRNFVRICLGFMLRSDIKGVTDFVRIGYRNDENPDSLYQRVIKFFRSGSFRLEDLQATWLGHLSSLDEQVPTLEGRRILIGDGVKQGKAGFHMAAVKRYAQSSESVAKADMIWGHLWGAVGLLTGNLEAKMFYTPINANIQDGNQTIKAWDDEAYEGKTHVMQMADAGIACFKNSPCSCLFALDRYFLTRDLISAVDKANAEKGDASSLCIITKAKCNCIAYEKPQPGPAKRRGRPPLKGRTVHLKDLFSSRSDEFQETELLLYGKMQKVRYLAVDCLWGMGLYREMRFVLVETNTLRSILVSSDTTVKAQTIITCYSLRWKCEESYLRSKHVLGAFSYHFWTKAMPKLNHYRKRTSPDPVAQVTSEHDKKRILSAYRATEVFAFIGQVAQGMLQLLSLKAHELGLATKKWLRTYSSPVNSEQTMAFDLASLIKRVIVTFTGSDNPVKLLELVA